MHSDAKKTAVYQFYAPLMDSSSAARRVGWQSDGLHELRLRALMAAAGPVENASQVLDVGCGEGALLPLLQEGMFNGVYRGEDVLPFMIERARSNHPDARFDLQNSFDAEASKADIVLCSGTLNTMDTSDLGATFDAALEALWARTNDTLALDFAVANRHSRGSLIATFDLEAAFRAARTLTSAVRVLEDTIPGEAILVLSRNQEAGIARIAAPPHLALTVAELHLRQHQPEAVRTVLRGLKSPKARLMKALADAQSGRIRNAETTLRTLAEDSSEAKLHLALVMMATRRQEAGALLLEDLRHSNDAFADEARYELMLYYAEPEPTQLPTLLEEIQDPWIHREALSLLDAGN
jgi:SAM-dependent methyltransferase